ncbi:MAG: hypothetical protein HW407_2136 [Bacteroidetes bacterium]|nr:hypothetical protein [Bacteroidota bacterium]
MHTSFSPEVYGDVLAQLRDANAAFVASYPGESNLRQAVHTVYGGAHIFKAETAGKLGANALNALQEYAPDFVEFARAIGLTGSEKLPKSRAQVATLIKKLRTNPDAVKRTDRPAWLAYTIYTRVVAKLQSEPVEDFRIDFEDGYGHRTDAEEDGHAVAVAEEIARGMSRGTLPPFIGIRIKPLTEELKMRGIRTLDIVISTLAARTGGKLPGNFVVTIPKVTLPGQVAALVRLFEVLEERNSIPAGSLKVELMVETPQSIITHDGASALSVLVAAGKGRCVSAHFGVYDYTASCSITAAHQSMTHPSCDFARHMMQVALAGTGITLSDGATVTMPVGPHRAAKGGKPLTAKQKAENRAVVHRAWKLAFDDVNHSLRHGYYQGWDLHPGQLPIRYAAVYAFFLEGLELASTRLKIFIEKAAQATLIGNTFDDAATGQGLLNFFLRGLNCRAITEEEAAITGLSLDELRSRSFAKILNGRRSHRT